MPIVLENVIFGLFSKLTFDIMLSFILLLFHLWDDQETFAFVFSFGTDSRDYSGAVSINRKQHCLGRLCLSTILRQRLV